MTDNELLVRFLDALGPATTEVVLIGGWAHRLLALHPTARPGVAPLATKDVDVLFRVRQTTVELSKVTGFPAATAMRVQIPNPVSFVLHKLLVSAQRRDRSKREKDVLYAYDTLVLFAASEDALRASAALVRKSLPRSSRTKLLKGAPHLESIGDSVRGAAEIARQSGRAAPPLADQIGSTLAAAIDRYLAE